MGRTSLLVDCVTSRQGTEVPEGGGSTLGRHYAGRMRGQPPFTVIVPTLQRSPRLAEVLDRCLEHPLVLEVIVINNAGTPIDREHPKLRVLDQGRNIFVNPAWNLGAREARGELLAIVNDDVLFEDEALTRAARILRRGVFGIVGPDRSTFHPGAGGRIGHRLARPDATTRYYGTFLCLRRRDYRPVPAELKIWGGDDWLVTMSPRPPAVLIRTPFVTDMSTTSRAPEFQRMFAAERAATVRLVDSRRGERWWHRPQQVLVDLRIRWHARTGR